MGLGVGLFQEVVGQFHWRRSWAEPATDGPGPGLFLSRFCVRSMSGGSGSGLPVTVLDRLGLFEERHWWRRDTVEASVMKEEAEGPVGVPLPGGDTPGFVRECLPEVG